MAAPPVLLVADDLAVIAAVKRVLGREGYECVLATSAADAVIGWGHALPGLVLLQPSVESDRGGVVLEELQAHPEAKLLRVVILGETVPGFAWPVEPLPIDPVHFAKTIEDNIRTGGTDANAWAVVNAPGAEAAPPPAALPAEPEADAWRATQPREVEPAEAANVEVPEPEAISTEETVVGPAPTPPPADAEAAPEPTAAEAAGFEAPAEATEPAPEPRPSPSASPVTEALEEKLFGDLAADVEASALQSVESTLQRAHASLHTAAAAPAEDEELQKLEDEVRAEAARRRASRQSKAVEVKPAPPTPPPLDLTPEDSNSGETSFEDLSDGPPPAQSQAHEVLARAEQMLIEAREQAEARRGAAEASARKQAHDVDALSRRAQHAEELVRSEREARATLEGELATAREEVAKLGSFLENEKELARVRQENALETAAGEAESERASLEARHTQAMDVLQGQLRAETQRRSEAERASERVARKLSETEATVAERDAQLNAVQEKLAELELVAATAQEESAKVGALEAVVAERDARISELEQQLATAREDADVAMALASEVDKERQRLEETRQQLQVAQQHLDEARRARDGAQSEMLQLEEAREALLAQVSELTGQLERARADMTSSSELLEETARERDGLRSKVQALEPFEGLAAKLGQELQAEKQARAELDARLQATSTALETTKSEAEKNEAAAQLATEKVRELEAREVMSLALPGRRPVGVARHGAVELEGLAQVVCQLVLGNAEVKLELGTSGGTRTLWFKRGQIVAAESTFDAESLIGRARRDGLIDARQEQELRLMRGATPRDQLEALKSRSFIRDIESVPLVQRYTEQVALDAFTEEQTQYRLMEEAPKPEVLLATVPRPTLPMLAESLRRAISPDQMLEKLGGGEAVPTATDTELELRALGFSERERKMLTWVDGEATVEDLSLASGLKPDVAFRALLVARMLGVIAVKAGRPKTEAPSGQLDVQRLEAKYDEVQDADYFTILGLSRSAGSDEVRRAFQRLSQEFDPLRFSGHPDATLQQRAQVVSNLLEEAAKALEDDRRRVEYARHLLD